MHCTKDGITTRHEGYQRLYDAFVRKESLTFKDSVTYFQEAKSLAHSLGTYDVWDEFEAGQRRKNSQSYTYTTLWGHGAQALAC